MRGTHRARAAAAVVLAAALLGGCGLLGGGADRDEPDWVLDEESGRYYRPDLVVQSHELIDEHFPMLEDVGSATIAEGRFTDPYERVPIPAPDDHWWQAVIELEPAQVDDLLAVTAASAASDLGGADVPEPVAEEQILAELVPTLEGAVQDCEGDWLDVTPALAGSHGTNVSEAGDLLDLAVVCADGTQLITSARDM